MRAGRGEDDFPECSSRSDRDQTRARAPALRELRRRCPRSSQGPGKKKLQGKPNAFVGVCRVKPPPAAPRVR